MPFAKFSPTGGPVNIIPTINGLMNCGYSIEAHVTGSTDSIAKISGNIEDVKPLILPDASKIADKTIVMATFLLRAGNDVLVGSNYTIEMHAVQDGNTLTSNTSSSGQLAAAVTPTQLSLILTNH